MTPSPSLRLAAILICVFLGLAAPGAALADSHEASEAPEAKAWDQAAVTAIAEKLAGSTTQLRTVARQTSATRTAAGTATRSQIEDDLRRLQSETRRYRDNLQAGKGLEETRGVYQRITQLHRDLEELGQRIMIQHSAEADVTDMRSALAQLAPYYAK